MWLCEGSRAWEDGYLLSPERAQELVHKEEVFDAVVSERLELRSLLSESIKQRDEYRVLADSLRELLDRSSVLVSEYRTQRDRFEEELVLVEGKYLDESRRRAVLQSKYDDLESDSWSTLELGLISAGVGVAAALVGAGIAVLIVEFK